MEGGTWRGSVHEGLDLRQTAGTDITLAEVRTSLQRFDDDTSAIGVVQHDQFVTANFDQQCHMADNPFAVLTATEEKQVAR